MNNRKMSFLASAATLGLAFCLAQPVTAFADQPANPGTPNNPPTQPTEPTQPTQPNCQRHHHHGSSRKAKKAFHVGLCAGQVLAGQGITLPMPGQNQGQPISDANRAALKAAVKQCKESFETAQRDDMTDVVDSIDQDESQQQDEQGEMSSMLN